MTDITCEVVRDLLPLYADDAVSADSRALVEEHLSGCEDCRKELENCKKEVRIPPEREVSLMKLLRARLLRKKVLLTLTAVLCTVLLLSGAWYCMLCYQFALPYDPETIQIVDVENDTVSFTASSIAFITTLSEQEVETDGKIERIVYIGFSYTPMNWLVDSRLRPQPTVDEIHSIHFSDSPNTAPISRIYYKMPDTYLSFGRTQFVPIEHNEEPVLLWEADGAPLSSPVAPAG